MRCQPRQAPFNSRAFLRCRVWPHSVERCTHVSPTKRFTFKIYIGGCACTVWYCIGVGTLQPCWLKHSIDTRSSEAIKMMNALGLYSYLCLFFLGCFIYCLLSLLPFLCSPPVSRRSPLKPLPPKMCPCLYVSPGRFMIYRRGSTLRMRICEHPSARETCVVPAECFLSTLGLFY